MFWGCCPCRHVLSTQHVQPSGGSSVLRALSLGQSQGRGVGRGQAWGCSHTHPHHNPWGPPGHDGGAEGCRAQHLGTWLSILPTPHTPASTSPVCLSFPLHGGKGPQPLLPTKGALRTQRAAGRHLSASVGSERSAVGRHTQLGCGPVNIAWPAPLAGQLSRAPTTCVCPGGTGVLATLTLARWPRPSRACASWEVPGGLLASRWRQRWAAQPGSCWPRLPPAGRRGNSCTTQGGGRGRAGPTTTRPSTTCPTCHPFWKRGQLCWPPSGPPTGWPQGRETQGVHRPQGPPSHPMEARWLTVETDSHSMTWAWPLPDHGLGSIPQPDSKPWSLRWGSTEGP